jgi:hypothetical protein
MDSPECRISLRKSVVAQWRLMRASDPRLDLHRYAVRWSLLREIALGSGDRA